MLFCTNHMGMSNLFTANLVLELNRIANIYIADLDDSA